MKNPQTKLGKKLARILNYNDGECVLLTSSKEYDTFQLDISDNQVIDFICHDYPGLAYGILINTKAIYALPESLRVDSLTQRVNEANLKSTSVITAVESGNEEAVFTLHFKTFIHLGRNSRFARTLNAAIDLHLREVDEVISPYFKNIAKEEK